MSLRCANTEQPVLGGQQGQEVTHAFELAIAG